MSGEILHKWSGIRVMDLAITNNGKTLIASSEKKIRLYDLETKSEVLALSETESITSVFIGQDDRFILVNLSIQVSFFNLIFGFFNLQKIGNSFMGYSREKTSS